MPLLAVRRPLTPVAHKVLRDHLREVNHRLSNRSLIWRPMGEAALFFVLPGEYLRVIGQKNAQLYGRDPGELRDKINTRVAILPTEGKRYPASVRKVDFFGRGRILQVACFLHPDKELEDEQQRIRAIIDEANGITAYWGDEPFDPFVSLATIEAIHADDSVLDIFDEFVPDELSLDKVQARIAR